MMDRLKQRVRNCLIGAAVSIVPATGVCQFASFPELGEVTIETPGVSETLNLIVVDVALSALGSSYSTRVELSTLIANIEAQRFALQQEFASELTASGAVGSLTYALVQFLPLTLRLEQTQNLLTAEISGIGFSAGGVASQGLPLFCEDPEFNIAVNDLHVGLSSNIITGQLTNPTLDFSYDIDVECNGLLSHLTNALLSLPIIDDVIEREVMKAVDDAITSANQVLASERIFGLNDFLPPLRMALANVNDITPAQRNLLEGAIDDVEDYLARLIIDSGKTLEITLSQRSELFSCEYGFCFNLIYNELFLTTNF